MSSQSGEADADAHNLVFDGISQGVRREVLRFLMARESPVTLPELASHVATADQRRARAEGAAMDKEQVQTALVHTHLPELNDIGLITWNRDEGTVETATHPAIDDPRLRLLLDADVEGLDEVLSNVSAERRRIILSVLRDCGSPMSRTALSEEIYRRETNSTEPDPESVNEIIASLYHAHLPALANAGLIDYDFDTGKAMYTGHPAVEEVFTIIHTPSERLVKRYDQFLGGLGEAYQNRSRESTEEAAWPHFWEEPYDG